ncbi:MAG: hypothetical protein MN733_30170, partial [Nitrososphaera sp.]|nr:hypothetical protein [Nitrososphaera sp.]
MRILVQHCKHGPRYFNATTDEQFHKAALVILAENMEMGFYDLPQEPEALDFDRTILDTLPATLKEEASKQIKTFESRLQHYRVKQIHLSRIKAILKNKDGERAWKLLLSRSRNQYEQ